MKVYTPENKIRIVTAASLFDGHDVAINMMRRILQSTGAEIIHLGHNRSVVEIVDTAIQEDVQAIAITSYQGGHMEFFTYMQKLLEERGSDHIQIFGGGGGTILPAEIEELHNAGIERIYSPEDGRQLGLQGMINEVMQKADYALIEPDATCWNSLIGREDDFAVGRLITYIENRDEVALNILDKSRNEVTDPAPVLGFTGTGGAGKSSLLDELILRFKIKYPQKQIGVLTVDPSKRKSGGALLGDRIRMNSIYNHNGIYMRSMATRQAHQSMSRATPSAIAALQLAGFDLIIVETSGIGQSGSEIVDLSDLSIYVMTPEFGAASQLEKIDMLDFADLVAINKFDKQGAQDALRDVRKQYRRNHHLWDVPEEDIPVYGTVASQFNDPGVNDLYQAIVQKVKEDNPENWSAPTDDKLREKKRQHIIPPSRVRYLSEIVTNNKEYDDWVEQQSGLASKWYALEKVSEQLDTDQKEILEQKMAEVTDGLTKENRQLVEQWQELTDRYTAEVFTYTVRKQEYSVETSTKSLSGTDIPKVALPRFSDWGDILRWQLQENVPGKFPYTAGVFPFKRKTEDPTRMFAGEGGPERTNKRFHYLSEGMPAARLSTAFDSVTLYGADPGNRPDVYGKVGNSGVNISCLDDAKILYSGFDLCDPTTSVSMTINGPAAVLNAFLFNAAIDQQCEKYIREEGWEEKVDQALKAKYDDKGIERPNYHGELPETNDGLGLLLLGITGDEILTEEEYLEIKAKTLKSIRGTIQADILKEDQAQNTCIFSTEYSLMLMGDMQQYFIDHGVRNFYSVSISGYHIAEAGANPITQLAFTLSNGFTYVEYYLSRGMDIDEFAPNLSFFFSNGIDAEYAVIGRVARRIWAKAMKYMYNANSRSQKLKYHIQTSGRSLHAQEIAFNDIRTTLQALYAIFDNCNSLHTNAYDEAITTPTEESVRRALAIQLIINHEMGLAKNENPWQGSFIIEELTDLVEEAVLIEFERLTDRGGVLGAMESMYQRSKIQEESMYYEQLKHSGDLPIIGVNTFRGEDNSADMSEGAVIRATKEEKEHQITRLRSLHRANRETSHKQLEKLQRVSLQRENVFEELMETVKFCSLGQITEALYKVGGQYRRNM